MRNTYIRFQSYYILIRFRIIYCIFNEFIKNLQSHELFPPPPNTCIRLVISIPLRKRLSIIFFVFMFRAWWTGKRRRFILFLQKYDSSNFIFYIFRICYYLFIGEKSEGERGDDGILKILSKCFALWGFISHKCTV